MSDFKLVTSHLNTHVREEIKVTCPVSVCGISYCNYKNFNGHINKHKQKSELNLKVGSIIDTVTANLEKPSKDNLILPDIPDSTIEIDSSDLDTTNKQTYSSY